MLQFIEFQVQGMVVHISNGNTIEISQENEFFFVVK